MSVTPQTAALDTPVTVSARGLPPDAKVMMLAKARDSRGTLWTATADFRATSAGVVSLNQPALGGAYRGTNQMGLFDFMAPSAADTTDTTFLAPKLGYDVTLQAEVNGRVVATTVARRQDPAALGVVEKDLRPATSGLYGDLFLPPGAGASRPAVLVFGGSGGGLTTTFLASLLAAHGYPALALAYFNEPGLPHALANIPLEYFTKALAVLREQRDVDPRHVLVMGTSRGSEAALLLGAHYPRLVNGVIAGVPSSVVNFGLPDTSQPAWTMHGHPLPHATRSDYGDPNPGDNPQAIIPVEKIAGPILLSCGEQDTVWNSCLYTDAITARLSAHHFRFPVTALHYPDAGHSAGLFTAYYSIVAAAATPHGGTASGNEAARADTHARLLSFLAAQ